MQLDFSKVPGVRFASTILKCFSPDSGQDNTLLHTMLRYAATIFFVIGGLTSIAYTYPTLYSVSLALLPEFWAKCATIAMVFFLFIVIDLLLSVSFPAVMEKIASGKAIRNRRTAFGTLALFALCGTLAWLSFTFSQSGSYTPAEAAVAYNKSLFPNQQPATKVSSVSEVEAIFEKDMQKLQDADDAKMASLVAKAHKNAMADRSYAWGQYGAAVQKGDQLAISKWNSLVAKYAADSSKTVSSFKPNSRLMEMAERKQNAILANQEAHSSVAKTTEATTKVELDKDQRKVEAIQLLLGKVGSYATLIGLILTIVYVFLKSGEAAPPSPITPAPIRFIGRKLASLKVFGGSGNSQHIDNQSVTQGSNNMFGNSNNAGSSSNNNIGGGNTSQVVTVTDPIDGTTERMSISQANTRFHQYKAKVENNAGDIISHVAYCRAIFDAIDYADSGYADSLKKRMLMANDAPRLLSMLGWK